MISIAKTTNGFDLSLLSKYRTEVMGVAMLMVLLCHARLHGADFPEFILSVLTLGDMGVDMFFFCSGIGIYFSLYSFFNKTSSNRSLVQWYKKRFIRILLPYIIIETPYWLYFCFNNHLGGG